VRSVPASTRCPRTEQGPVVEGGWTLESEVNALERECHHRSAVSTSFFLNQRSRCLPVESDERLREILALGTIAVVGCSTTPGKAAHDIPRYMLDHGYEVIPVNPNTDEVFGRPAYDSLSMVPAGVDIVDVFRTSEEVSGIVNEALAREDAGVIWTQLGIRDDVAAERAEALGKRVVQDRCLKIEHQRFM